MVINKEIINDLIRYVVLPFDKIIFDDERINQHLDTQEKRTKHNIALAKLAISLMRSDLNRAKKLLKEGAAAHNGLEFDKEILRDYLTIFFALMRRWMRKYFPEKVEMYSRQLLEFEQVFVDAYKPFVKIENDEFFDFDSEEVDDVINDMHYKDEQKIDAVSFMKENIFDDGMVADLLDAIDEYDIDVEHRDIFDIEYIKAISEIFEKFARIFEVSYEFNDISYSIRILIEKLNSMDIKNFNHEQKELYKIFLVSIVEDLKKWINEVAIEQSAKDIHYLDASLLANIAQIDMMVPSNLSKDNNEDIDFF